ncbi:MAG: hypothetical protein ABQ298_10755 [Puniceicoccaceae bacterium]
MMKRFLVKVMLFATAVLGFVVCVNLIGDPANLFVFKYEENLANELLSGNNVSNIANFDERQLQRHYIEGLETAPDYAVLGSSRTLMIRDDFLTNSSLRNHSVSGASLEDLIGIFQLYRETGKLPDHLLIGIDPWVFNERNGQIRWKSIADAYWRFHGKSEAEEVVERTLFDLQQLISVSYFQSSLWTLLTNRNKGIQVTDTETNDGKTRLWDGSMVYGSHVRERQPLEVNRLAHNYIQGGVYSLDHFDSISETLWKEFSEWIEVVLAHQIEVAFVMVPYHPKVSQHLAQDYPVVAEVEKRVRSFAQQHQIPISGSFDARNLGFDNTAFYDAMHCRPFAVRQLAEPLLNPYLLLNTSG